MNAPNSTPADRNPIPDTRDDKVPDPSDMVADPSNMVPDPSNKVADSSDPAVRELAEIPAVEVITRAAVMLMSAAAEKLGLAEDGARFLDRDEARRLITALAGLYAAAGDDLGAHRRPIADGLRGLQAAFRDAAPIPDPPGQGPGESIRRPI